MNDEQRQLELNRRYQNDPVFHNLVDLIVKLLEDHSLTRWDIADALVQADRIVWLNSQKV